LHFCNSVSRCTRSRSDRMSAGSSCLHKLLLCWSYGFKSCGRYRYNTSTSPNITNPKPDPTLQSLLFASCVRVVVHLCLLRLAFLLRSLLALGRGGVARRALDPRSGCWRCGGRRCPARFLLQHDTAEELLLEVLLLALGRGLSGGRWRGGGGAGDGGGGGESVRTNQGGRWRWRGRAGEDRAAK
jgi:uncharacterized membrane protein YgcG